MPEDIITLNLEVAKIIVETSRNPWHDPVGFQAAMVLLDTKIKEAERALDQETVERHDFPLNPGD